MGSERETHEYQSPEFKLSFRGYDSHQVDKYIYLLTGKCMQLDRSVLRAATEKKELCQTLEETQKDAKRLECQVVLLKEELSHMESRMKQTQRAYQALQNAHETLQQSIKK